MVDAGEFVFDRVFCGDDFFVRAVEVVEAGVEGGGFAGTGGAGHQNDAVGQGDEAVEGGFVIREEAELRQTQRERGFIQNTHDDGFAVVGGDGADTQVNVRAAAQIQLDASVLWDAFLGDAHARTHDFESRDDGPQQFLGMVGDFHQAAVDAVADAYPVFHRFDVYIGGAHFMGFIEHVGDQFNDRGFHVAFDKLLFFRIVFVECFFEAFFRHDKEVDVAAEELGQAVEVLHVEGVGYGYLKVVAVVPYRDEANAAGQGAFDCCDDGWIYGEGGEIHIFHAGFLGGYLRYVFAGQVVVFHQVVDDAVQRRDLHAHGIQGRIIYGASFLEEFQ